MDIRGKKILLGVCGSIAAYKSAYLVRLLVKEGAEVKVIMTKEAENFVSPLTFSTLSKNPVYSELTNADQSQWNNHVELGLWADLFLIAPVTANTIAKLANGFCDNLLSAVYLSARCPVWISPAMDEDMWKHASTKENIRKLESYGNIVLKVNYGELASGLTGEGRMAEPEEILEQIKKKIPSGKSLVTRKGKLSGKKALVTAGPTYEPIDPVRFIGNYSSGKMGIALAEALSNEGADVTLVLGPVKEIVQDSSIKIERVKTAEEMYAVVEKHFSKSDITVMAAAVADYTPVKKAKEKIKKENASWQLELKKTTDILKESGKKKKKNQILGGFALETINPLEHAHKKLDEKNLDFIVLNSIRDAQSGFEFDTNKITIIDKKHNVIPFELKTKKEAARDIVQYIISLLHV